MSVSHYTLLLIAIVLSSCYGSSEEVFINTSREFEQFVCNNTYSQPTISLVLNSSVMYNITTDRFCFMSTVDITIRSGTNSPAVISCVHDDHMPVPTLGLAFINSSVTLQGVTFINCGTNLSILPDNVIKMFNYTSLYYSSTHAAALLFIQCTVNMIEIELTSSYGFAVIGINPVSFIVQNVNVSNSSASSTIYNHYNKTIGCGMILHFISYPQTQELKSREVSIDHARFFFNIDSQDRSACVDKMDPLSSSEMVVYAAALTIIYAQDNYQANDYQANVLVSSSIFSNNSGTIGGAILIVQYNSYMSFIKIHSTDFKGNALLGIHHCYGADVSFNFLTSLIVSTFKFISPPLIIENTTFHDALLSLNEQTYFKAGAVYIGIKKNDIVNMTLLFKDVICSNTFATHTGVCMFAEVLGRYKDGSVSVILESIIASNNSLVTLASIPSSAGIFTFHGVNFYITGTKKKPSNFSNNFGNVIDATDTNISLSGDILFDGNKGTSGAAIEMKYGNRLHFMNGLTANFTNNQAELFGGAIYADISNRNWDCAFYFQSNDMKLFFNNNIATEAGNDIYAFPIYNCQFDDSNHSYTPDQAMRFYNQVFRLIDGHGERVLSFSTKPKILLLNNTVTSNGKIYTYPGQMVSLNLSALDELNHFVYTIVRVEIASKKRDSIT